MQRIGSPSLPERLQHHWQQSFICEPDEQIVGMAFRRSRRTASRGFVVTTKRVVVYKTLHDPTLQLDILQEPAEVDVKICTITHVKTTGPELVLATAGGRTHTLGFTRDKDAEFIAAKIAQIVGLQVVRIANTIATATPAAETAQHAAASTQPTVVPVTAVSEEPSVSKEPPPPLTSRAKAVLAGGAALVIATTVLIWQPWSAAEKDDQPVSDKQTQTVSDEPTQIVLYPSVHCSTPAGRREASEALSMWTYIDWWQDECTDPRDAAALIDQFPGEFCDVGMFARVEHLVTKIPNYDYLAWSETHCPS